VVEAAIGHERVKMYEQSQVVSKTLDDHEDTGMQVARRRKAMLAFDEAAQGLHDARSKPLADESEQVGVVAKACGHRAFEGEDPLTPRSRRKAIVDPQRCALGHRAAHAGWANPSAFAGKRNAQGVATPAALGEQEAALEVSAGDEGLELAAYEGG